MMRLDTLGTWLWIQCSMGRGSTGQTYLVDLRNRHWFKNVAHEVLYGFHCLVLSKYYSSSTSFVSISLPLLAQVLRRFAKFQFRHDWLYLWMKIKCVLVGNGKQKEQKGRFEKKIMKRSVKNNKYYTYIRTSIPLTGIKVYNLQRNFRMQKQKHLFVCSKLLQTANSSSKSNCNIILN